MHLVKRDHRRGARIEELVQSPHLRHDELEKGVADACAAAERAAAAARGDEKG